MRPEMPLPETSMTLMPSRLPGAVSSSTSKQKSLSSPAAPPSLSPTGTGAGSCARVPSSAPPEKMLVGRLDTGGALGVLLASPTSSFPLPAPRVWLALAGRAVLSKEWGIGGEPWLGAPAAPTAPLHAGLPAQAGALAMGVAGAVQMPGARAGLTASVAPLTAGAGAMPINPKLGLLRRIVMCISLLVRSSSIIRWNSAVMPFTLTMQSPARILYSSWQALFH
mmetsp:Transcript_69915/g.193321  ORF Transcript_69915/g.193321 Transcript_69915/m.193321 type:complete len:223 (-) Transcript_69915:835-1503(-)